MNVTQDVAISSRVTAINHLRDDVSFIQTLRRYFFVIALLNLIWEFAHMPLYTLWDTGGAGEIVFAAVHCTGGDILIAMTTLLIPLLIFGDGWPYDRIVVKRVIVSTMILGVGYTVFSEWLNIVVRKAWAYSELMPVVPIIDTGLSPLLQWIVIPALAFAWALRPSRGRSRGAQWPFQGEATE